MTATTTHDYPSLSITNHEALTALAVGSTADGGHVRSRLADYLLTPPGRWAETIVRRTSLDMAIASAATCTMEAAIEARRALVEAAIAARWPRHPDRD